MRNIILGVTTALAVGGANAQAYVGGALTANQTYVDCSGTLSCTTHSGSGKAYVGYVSPKYGVGGEIAYLLLGNAKSAKLVSGTRVETVYEGTGVAASMIARGAVTRAFWVHAKLGVEQVTLTATPRSDAGGSLSDYSKTPLSPYLGLGMEFGFVENIKLVAFIDRTKGKIDGQSVSMHAIGLGIEALF